jgi:hypothetical protein
MSLMPSAIRYEIESVVQLRANSMAKTRDVLIHLSVETAIRKRKCHHSRGKHQIAAGEQFLSVREGSGLGAKNYCKVCAHPMLTAAKEKFTSILQALD